MIGTITLTHLGWFVTSSEAPFGYPLYYLDLRALAFRSDIKLDDRHGQAVEFTLIDITDPLTQETVIYASIIKLHDDTIKLSLLTRLEKHIDSITSEEFQKEIEEIEKEMDPHPDAGTNCGVCNGTIDLEGMCYCNSISPKDEVYICEMEDCPHCAYERQQEYEAELEKEACIDFAKWLAQDWMSIWVGDKWMWECQTDGIHLGYKTEEELYELYLKSV